jgi:hypothetical protein
MIVACIFEDSCHFKSKAPPLDEQLRYDHATINARHKHDFFFDAAVNLSKAPSFSSSCLFSCLNESLFFIPHATEAKLLKLFKVSENQTSSPAIGKHRGVHLNHDCWFLIQCIKIHHDIWICRKY